MNKRIINWIGRVLLILSLIFIINKIMEYDIEWQKLFNIKIFFVGVFCILIHGLNVFCATFTYKALLSMIVNKKVDQSVITEIYCKANLYKYLPGNVMHYIGRNQIAVELSLSHAEVAFATVIEMVSLILGSVLIALICSSSYLIEYLILFGIDFTMLICVCGIILVLLLIMGVVFRKRLARILKKYAFLVAKENLFKSTMVFVKSSLRLIVNAVVFIILLYFFDLRITDISLLVAVVGMFVLSWVIGFLTPGAPGGLGVREFIMTMLFAGIFMEETLLLVLVLYRVVCILGDMASYLYALIYGNIKKYFKRA